MQVDAPTSDAVAEVPQIVQAMALVQDFAYGIDGALQGLTVAEFDRAWRARGNPGKASVGVLYVLRDQGLVMRTREDRRCAVLGVWRHAWVPAVMVAGEQPCS